MKIDQKNLMALTMAWLFFGLAQATHFHYYFDRSWATALTWGMKNWLIWFVLIHMSFRWFNFHIKMTTPLPLILFTLGVLALMTGVFQIAIIIILDNLFFGYDKPYIEGFWNLYKKRWFQNVLIFSILWVFFTQLQRFSAQLSKTTEKVRENNETWALKITDNHQHLWLEYNQIKFIEVTGNYLCFFTTDGQHVTRGTLKELTTKLSEHGFIKISRSLLVNSTFIQAYQRSGQYSFVTLKNHDQPLSVSRRYRSFVKSALDL